MQKDTNVVYIARVKGSAYEMGFAYGQMFGDYVAKNINNMQDYLRSKLKSALTDYGVPFYMLDIVYAQIEPLIFYAADTNWQIAKPFVPQRFIDELQGITDGSNGTVTFEMVMRANILPELTQAACSIVGAWGASTKDGRLLHLRALDWEPTAPVNEFPSVILYEPSEEGSHAFTNIGFLGLIGSITAMSKIGISVGEKVICCPSPGEWPELPQITYNGKPWTFVLRDTI